MQDDDSYRGLHDECGAAKNPHLLSLSWNTSYPNDEGSCAATLDSEGNQHQKNGCTGLLEENHFPDRSRNLRGTLSLSCFPKDTHMERPAKPISAEYTASQPGWLAEGLAAHNVIALNASHRVAGIHHQGCVLRDPGVIVIRMICDD